MTKLLPGDIVVKDHNAYRQWLRHWPDEEMSFMPERDGFNYVDSDEMMLIVSVDPITTRMWVLTQRGWGWIHPGGDMRKL